MATGDGACHVIVATTQADAPGLASRLAALGVAGLASEPAGATRLIMDGTVATGAEARSVVRTLRSEGLAAIEGPASSGQAVGWNRRNAPVWFADGACVCFPWSRFDRSLAGTIVEIDPAGGFGAGRHPSTLLLLSALAQHGCPGTVLDVGCGSGVLAVAAALLGAEQVTAIDLSPTAVAATTANARRNGVGHVVHASTDPLADVARPPGGYDVVVANIHAPTLTAMAPDLRRMLAPSGWLGISGISRAQVSLLVRALEPLAVLEHVESDDWVALRLATS